MEILIPILMFLIPVAAAIIDKQKRKQSSRPEVLSQPILFPEVENEVREQTVPQPAPISDVTAKQIRKPSKAAARPAETRPQKRVMMPETLEEEKLHIDPKMLIIYSEILKPKFDE